MIKEGSIVRLKSNKGIEGKFIKLNENGMAIFEYFGIRMQQHLENLEEIKNDE